MRLVIVGGPSRGKSTLADILHRKHGWPVFCGDPASKVLFQKPYTTYLPEGLPFAGDNGAAAYVAEHWFRMPGPWICEGHVMARALRRWLGGCDWPIGKSPEPPCDRIVVLGRCAHRQTTRGQEAMHQGVLSVWDEIEGHYDPISEHLNGWDPGDTSALVERLSPVSRT